MKRHLATLFVTVSFFACGTGGEDSETTGPMMDYPTQTEPLLPGTALRIELEEQTIPAGKDLVLCHFLGKVDEELYVTAFESMQGKHGHHLIIFKARVPEAEGTVRDCTAPIDMLR